eukprot:CAMPEP_0116137296 /NCGR_PEP_ID=MMETSP0329-20121206/12176_1 /TAXON_ID=697910 /ORGANISM="Pseudo-nitzschia arenysensis, Strain B593" /LENGTH=699 /DNA_ID=CAMNT_0003632209 /DNA_START=344 /DNA_END=2443 /DNA_ORIENTATION=-
MESREEEIRQKIEKLKEEGRLGEKGGSSEASTESKKKRNVYDDYADKVQGKLGKRQGQLLGFTGDGTKNWGKASPKKKEYDIDDFVAEEAKADAAEMKSEKVGDAVDQDDRGRQVGKQDGRGRRVATIGSLPEEMRPSTEPETILSSESEEGVADNPISINPSLFDIPEIEDEPPELAEDELVELVAERLAEKRATEDAEIEAAAVARREEQARLEAMEETTTEGDEEDGEELSTTKNPTSGVGGSWSKSEDEPEKDYKPKVGGWGVFARPKSISEAYGGGRRIGAGYDKADDQAKKLETQRRLKEYRAKVGIDVPSEKEHAAEIEEALSIGQRAMQRGVYATAVSALEKVTQWCSTNSKVGSKVYLELAMAYEAVGRTNEAAQVYKTLSECRMEDVKYNAKRLLYGLEAMEVMKSVSSDFTRKKTRNAFIDATGLDNIAANFDDVYQTAYVDLDNGYYKKLTESVVRSTREARQILIKAEGKGEISRTRIVQALRCLSRQFDEMLQNEIDSSIVQQPTAYLDGKPIEKGPAESSRYGVQIGSLGDFTLLSANEMMENIDGEWKLQLLADKSGDGVSFFNTTVAIQNFSTEDMTFSASGPSGLGTEKCSGQIAMDASKRILSKEEIESSSSGVGGILSMISGGKSSGFPAAVSQKQQIVSVDSLLLITRCARGSRKSGDLDKEYFGVWRRVFPEDDDLS